jgi:hypothetical protein
MTCQCASPTVLLRSGGTIPTPKARWANPAVPVLDMRAGPLLEPTQLMLIDESCTKTAMQGKRLISYHQLRNRTGIVEACLTALWT